MAARSGPNQVDNPTYGPITRAPTEPDFCPQIAKQLTALHANHRISDPGNLECLPGQESTSTTHPAPHSYADGTVLRTKQLALPDNAQDATSEPTIRQALHGQTH
jgi:hypothetical protein